MNHTRTIQANLPDGLSSLRLPAAVERRVRDLLDKQEREGLALVEREEAEGLVELNDLISLLKAQARVVSTHPPS